MVLSDRDRKQLWARAHDRCAMCGERLTRDGQNGDPFAIIGIEAHIVARSAEGPRGGLLPKNQLDSYDNLILLCPTDHTTIDVQPLTYTVEYLRQLKREHEEQLHAEHDSAPLQDQTLVDDPAYPQQTLDPISNGAELWEVLRGVQAYALYPVDDYANAEDRTSADEFLDFAKHIGEASLFISDQGVVAVRDAVRQLDDAMKVLIDAGLMIFALRKPRLLIGGVLRGRPSQWTEAHVRVSSLHDVVERIRRVTGESPGGQP